MNTLFRISNIDQYFIQYTGVDFFDMLKLRILSSDMMYIISKIPQFIFIIEMYRKKIKYGKKPSTITKNDLIIEYVKKYDNIEIFEWLWRHPFKSTKNNNLSLSLITNIIKHGNPKLIIYGIKNMFSLSILNVKYQDMCYSAIKNYKKYSDLQIFDTIFRMYENSKFHLMSKDAIFSIFLSYINTFYFNNSMIYINQDAHINLVIYIFQKAKIFLHNFCSNSRILDIILNCQHISRSDKEKFHSIVNFKDYGIDKTILFRFFIKSDIDVDLDNYCIDNIQIVRECFRTCISEGYLRSLKWIHSTFPKQHGDPDCFHIVKCIENGYMDVIIWLYEEKIWNVYDSYILYEAIINKQITICNWIIGKKFVTKFDPTLFKNIYYGPVFFASIVEYNIISVINIIDPILIFQNVSIIINAAIKYNNIFFIDWLHKNNYRLDISEQIIDTTLSYGRINFIDWFRQHNINITYSYHALDDAFEHGYYDILNYFINNQLPIKYNSAFKIALKKEHYTTFEYFCTNIIPKKNITFVDKKIIDIFLLTDYNFFIKFISFIKINYSIDIFNKLFKSNRIDILIYFKQLIK